MLRFSLYLYHLFQFPTQVSHAAAQKYLDCVLTTSIDENDRSTNKTAGVLVLSPRLEWVLHNFSLHSFF